MIVSVTPVWFHEITLAPEPQSIAAARRFVRRHLGAHGLALLVDDIVLVASELATNALAHAGTSFTVSLTAFAGTVVLAVRDGSAAFPERVDARAQETAGRGVAIVSAVSREWGVVADGTAGKSVWAAFDAG